ncbi:Kinase family protein [Quillaja saponaria]|uniref:Kinase family protein n=1 Tax=Quillaja saponaria TaxID=32244 RepID=A0AAD7M5P9_QUISA|nr:Kinase family protein [Quillaja saponaria]
MLLVAVKQGHDKGVCHGDIKCENELITSWNWLYLTDFASCQPTYIPYNDPSNFSFFFDSGGRRLFCIAPKLVQDAPLRPSMDTFSVGLAFSQLFSVGVSHYLTYPNFSPIVKGNMISANILRKCFPLVDIETRSVFLLIGGHCQKRKKLIPDPGIRNMIQLEPESRLSAESTGLGMPSKGTTGELLQEMVAKENENFTKDSEKEGDKKSPDRSYCICGPSLKGVGNDDLYEARSGLECKLCSKQDTKRRPLTTKLTSKAVLAAAATDSASCHRDSILYLASLKWNQRLLISSSRDGTVKVWK